MEVVLLDNEEWMLNTSKALGQMSIQIKNLNDKFDKLEEKRKAQVKYIVAFSVAIISSLGTVIFHLW